jgi:hypothetical protein
MSVKIKVSVKDREQNSPELVKIAGIVREALRAEGLFNGSDTGEPTRFGKGYSFNFEVKNFHMINRTTTVNQKETVTKK